MKLPSMLYFSRTLPRDMATPMQQAKVDSRQGVQKPEDKALSSAWATMQGALPLNETRQEK